MMFLGKLENELFQQHNNASTVEMQAKTSSWTSCIHLQLYRYIVTILAKVRVKLYEKQGNQRLNNGHLYVFHEKYFLSKISKTLMKRSKQTEDVPYVWKTTKGYRKRDIGKFVPVDMVNLMLSTGLLESHLIESNDILLGSLASSSVVNSTTTRTTIQNLHSLNNKNLHGILMKIPYDLTSLLSNSLSRRPGTFLTLLHILMASLLNLGVRSNMAKGTIIWTELLAVDANKLYDMLQGDDPFGHLTPSTSVTQLNKARLSYIHLLWDSKKSFVESSKKIKAAIKSRLQKKSMTNRQTASSGFQLDDLETAMQRFVFDSEVKNIREMIESGSGRFDGINSELVTQMKVLCLHLYIISKNKNQRKVSKLKSKMESHPEIKVLECVMKKCHTADYFNSVSNFNGNRNTNNNS